MITAAVLGAWRSFLVLARSLADADTPRPSADRSVLEAEILPWLAARFERLPLPGYSTLELRIPGANRHVYARYRRAG